MSTGPTARPGASVPRPGVDLDALMAIQDLEWRSRTLVRGLSRGLHPSPLHGYSAEFSEFRPYVTGDDLRFLDWRVLGRTDRLYMRRFEEETNQRCHFVFDASRSMGYGSVGHTKWDYAVTLGATLARFLHDQGDAVGVVVFDEEVRTFVPARRRSGHLRRLHLALEATPSGGGISPAQVVEVLRRTAPARGMVVLFSDWLDDVASWEPALSQLKASGHEVALLQILDPVELDLSFGGPVLLQDVESGHRIALRPETARREYRERFQAHLDAVEEGCGRLGVIRLLVRTNEDPGKILRSLLMLQDQAVRAGHRVRPGPVPRTLEVGTSPR